MRKYVVFLLVAIVTLLGCAQPSAPVVTLQSPANGSSVSSLTPILAWTCTEADASYRLQLATDGNFQNLVIDKTNLTGPSYTILSGKLTSGQTYYWKVSASKGGQTSGWSIYWSFQVPTATGTTGTIVVNATLNGSLWKGAVNYTISGVQAHFGSSVPQSFSNLPVGTYTVGYNSGGPPGATLASITPSPTQILSPGGTITFILNFIGILGD